MTTANQDSQPASETKLRVAVLYGGQSSEHSVSCISAGAIIDNLDRERFDIVPVGITPSGAWVPGTTDTSQLRARGRDLPEVQDYGEHIQLIFGNGGELRYVSGEKAGQTFATVDVVFPVLHGLHGEDGTVQGVLDLLGLPYVGNGVLASAAGMDKDVTKRLAAVAGIPVADGLILTEHRELTADEQERLGLPVFVKPACGGSSIGVSKVDRWEEFPAALTEGLAHDAKVLVEGAIVGEEVECGVLQTADGTVLASKPGRLLGTLDGDEGFYGFEAKYLGDTVSSEVPAKIAQDKIDLVRRYAIDTFTALGCEGLARVDFFVTDDGVVLNEINTLPGFTPISMYPELLKAEGYTYEELLTALVERALMRKG